LVVNSANVTAQLSTNSLSILNQVNLVAGTLNPNALELSLAGNWNNSGGLLTATSGTVTFNSSLAQSILKSGGETFNAVHFGGAGLKTLSAPLTANASFSIGTGASVDVSTSNYSLNLRGNYTNNGTFCVTQRIGESQWHHSPKHWRQRCDQLFMISRSTIPLALYLPERKI
jgi:hypothetical protein